MVYVDDFNAPYGRMIMCHMIANSPQELLDMAKTIGVKSKWLQYPGTYKEHFDVCLSSKSKAIQSGAIEITKRELVEIIQNRKAIKNSLTPHN